MKLHFSNTIRFTLIAAMAAGAIACKTTPPPQAQDPYVPPPQTQTQEMPRTPQTPPGPTQSTLPPPVTSNPGAITPGSVQDFVVNAGDRVYFDTDSYSVRSDARPVLDAQASWLARYPQVQVRIEGNADERGTREYNFALGERRANAVRDYLISRGVSGSRIDVVSYGKDRPIDPGTNEEAWQRNRNGHTAITGGAR